MTRVLLITANLGSILDQSELIIKQWILELNKTVSHVRPQFIGIHCQEMGGKHFENSMTKIHLFIDSIRESLKEYSRATIFIDEDYRSATFTALGSLYFAKKCVDLHIWHFGEQLFLPVMDHVIHLGNIEEIQTKEKYKFSKDFSRKGLMRTRWRLSPKITMDLVNVHLFHDASNITANQKFPSEYVLLRRKSLEFTLSRVSSQPSIPLFIFGDFNFRLDSRALIEKITEKELIIDPKEEIIEIKDKNNEILVKIGRKRFEFKDLELFEKNFSKLLEFDKELEHFCDILYELSPIGFPPSYPFVEIITNKTCFSKYMTTRCPAWCDRILMNRSARSLVTEYHYSMIGLCQPMGDHKPIYCDILLDQSSRYVCVQSEESGVKIYRETTID